MMNERLARCASINLENLVKFHPEIAEDPFYRIAKAQLDEALGGMTVEDNFALDMKRFEKEPHAQDKT